jgi:hypothetical protein
VTALLAAQLPERPAGIGEFCTCGRPAVTVFEGGRFGPVGYCGLPDGGDRSGPCAFCGADDPHGGRCPAYSVRPAVWSLNYGELTAALAASNMPTNRVIGRVEATAYAAQGLARLGLSGVRAESARASRLAHALASPCPPTGAKAEYLAMYGGQRRGDRARGTADSIAGAERYAAFHRECLTSGSPCRPCAAGVPYRWYDQPGSRKVVPVGRPARPDTWTDSRTDTSVPVPVRRTGTGGARA